MSDENEIEVSVDEVVNLGYLTRVDVDFSGRVRLWGAGMPGSTPPCATFYLDREILPALSGATESAARFAERAKAWSERRNEGDADV